MIRKLTIMAAAMTTAVAFTALSATMAGAVEEQTLSAYFEVNVTDEETMTIDGEQIGTNTIAVGTLPSITCTTIKYNGAATTAGPAPEEVTISPQYEGCHVTVPLIGTRTTTVITNGCTLAIKATATITESGTEHLNADTNLGCPAGKQIEVHVYNTSSGSDSGASMLCTYDIGAQSGLSGITLTNKANTPTSVDDVVAHFNVGSMKVTRTAGSEAICGKESQTAVYKGEATMRATNAASEFIEAQSKVKKRFSFGDAPALVIGEKGSAEFTTEKKPIKCTGVKYDATVTGQYVKELSITPSYPSCTWDGLTTHVKFEGCTYLQTMQKGIYGNGEPGETGKGETHTKGPMHIECTGGKKITFTVTKDANITCTFTFGKQTPQGVVDQKNLKGAKSYVTFTNTLKSVSYEVTGDATTCGKNGQLLTDGQIHGDIDMLAYEDNGGAKGAQISFRITGEAAP